MEYRIDELAQAARTTVRNVRAYQERGLLPPPRRDGRVGWYSEAHLARLRIIGALLERGYSLGNIGELLDAWEHGNDLRDLLGLEAAVMSPFTDEVPQTIELSELLDLFGSVDLSAIARAVKLGLLTPEEDRLRVSSMRVLRAGAELHRMGVPLSELLDEIEALRRDVAEIARRFVALVARNVFDRYQESLPPAEATPKLTDMVKRMRPLAELVVDTELAHALEREIGEQLGERVARLLDRERGGTKRGHRGVG